jgi:hypothetical protein
MELLHAFRTGNFTATLRNILTVQEPAYDHPRVR